MVKWNGRNAWLESRYNGSIVLRVGGYTVLEIRVDGCLCRIGALPVDYGFQLEENETIVDILTIEK